LRPYDLINAVPVVYIIYSPTLNFTERPGTAVMIVSQRNNHAVALTYVAIMNVMLFALVRFAAMAVPVVYEC